MTRRPPLYTLLGVRMDATADQIRTAYRRLARKWHPDRNGGKDDKFKAIQEAYDVLIDPERRARYDATGETKTAMDKQFVAVLAMLSQVLVAVVKNTPSSREAAGVDVVASMRTILNNNKNELNKTFNANMQNLAKLEVMMTRFKVKDGAENLLENLCRNHIAQIKATNERIREAIAVVDRAVETIKSFSYQADIDDFFRPYLTPRASLIINSMGM